MNCPITPDIFLKLQCDLCKNCLSYFPIYMTKDAINICGRCSDKLQEDQAQNIVIYETVAQFMKFPCRYKNEGCSEFLFPKDIPNHEEICDFQTIQCLTQNSTNCKWEGFRVSLFSHCQEAHPDVILKNGSFELDLSQSYQRENLLECNTNVFNVKHRFCVNTKLVEFWIRSLGNAERIKELPFELSLKRKSLRMGVQSVIAAFSKEQALKLLLDCFKYEEDSSSTIITGEITFKNDEEKVPVLEKIDKDLLSSLKCKSCTKFALPPLFVAENRNSTNAEQDLYCFRCCFPKKEQATRNLHLDELANKLNYPCLFAEFGCTFIAKPLLMKQHVAFCTYGINQCPVKDYVQCKWYGNGSHVNTHILEKHKSLILNLPTVSTWLSPFMNIIEFSGHLFLLNFITENEYITWLMQPISPLQKQFMFQVEIIDRNHESRSLITKQMCTAFTERDKIKEFKDYYFTKDQLAPFLSEYMITFKINICE